MLYDKIIGLISFILICLISIFLKYNFYELVGYFFIIIFFFGIIVINQTPVLIFKILKLILLKEIF